MNESSQYLTLSHFFNFNYVLKLEGEGIGTGLYAMVMLCFVMFFCFLVKAVLLSIVLYLSLFPFPLLSSGYYLYVCAVRVYDYGNMGFSRDDFTNLFRFL